MIGVCCQKTNDPIITDMARDRLLGSSILP